MLKEDSRYATWVDIIMARCEMPQFNEFADQAREFFAAEISAEQRTHPIEGALHTSAPTAPPTGTTCHY